MKIPVHVYSFAGGVRAMAHFFLKSEELKIFVIINAIIDTGSPNTIIGFDDIKKRRISFVKLKKLEDRKEPLTIGGGKLKTKILKKANLTFTEDFNPEMEVLMSYEKTDGEDTKATSPSVIGVDFLEKNKLKFVFNPDKREAYFEMDESPQT